MPLVPSRGRARRALAALLVAVLATAALAVPAAAADAPRYRPPVDAPIVDPFRPPATPYGPGNRGLDYGTAPGTVVRAAADGRVTFAGLVAGARHVTVLHDDGLRTTASYLATIDVVVGQRVHQGDRLGTTAGQLHFSARNGDAYLDPAALFGAGPPHVHLVPFDDPPGTGERGERSAIRQLLGFAGKVAGGAADFVRNGAPDLVDIAEHYAAVPAQLVLTQLQAVMAAWDTARRPCTASSTPAPRSGAGHVAVLVGGFGSTSDDAAVDHVDVDRLGYARGDVVRFSYAGGRTPGGVGGAPRRDVPAHEYDADDADGDLRSSGGRLADLVDRLFAAEPGRPVDVIAHSQGGIVARLAVIELEARHGPDWLRRVGLLATLGTPHQGDDLATLSDALASSALGRGVQGFAATQGLDAGAPAVDQLSQLSDLMTVLDAHPIPSTLRAVSIAARGDLVVPLPRTRLAGAPQVVVPLGGIHAHDQLPGDPATTRALALALAGEPPGCRGFAGALEDQEVGAAIAQTEDTLSAGAWGLAMVGDLHDAVPAPDVDETRRRLRAADGG